MHEAYKKLSSSFYVYICFKPDANAKNEYWRYN